MSPGQYEHEEYGYVLVQSLKNREIYSWIASVIEVSFTAQFKYVFNFITRLYSMDLFSVFGKNFWDLLHHEISKVA